MPASPAPLAPDVGFNRLKDCRHGRMLYNVHDQYVGRSFDLYGEFSEGETDLFAKIVGPGDVVIEVGANIGSHTVWFAKAVGQTGAVLAYEPQRLAYQVLCANMALNGLVSGYCFNQAAGATPGQIVVPVLDPNVSHNFGGLALGQFKQGEAVAVITLDSLRVNRCKLLKVDVEGMELDVLRGGQRLITTLRPFLYVENDRPHLSDALIRFIDRELGYDCFWHRPALYNPDNFFANPDNVFGNIASFNMLCAPRGFEIVGLPKVDVPPAPPA